MTKKRALCVIGIITLLMMVMVILQGCSHTEGPRPQTVLYQKPVSDIPVEQPWHIKARNFVNNWGGAAAIIYLCIKIGSGGML